MSYTPIQEFLSQMKPLPQKDFDTWNNQKKIINKIFEEIFFRRREIWWCRIGLNIGQEQDGKGGIFERPVLVLRKLSAHTFIGVPITTLPKESFIHKKFFLPNGQWRVATISQIRLFDARRLTTYITILAPDQFFPIVKAVQNLLEPLSDILPGELPEKASLGDNSLKANT